MLFLEFLLHFRNAGKAVKKVKLVRLAQAAAEAENLEQIATQAAAYGWEIGWGQLMIPEVQAHPDNPFLKPNWRDAVHD